MSETALKFGPEWLRALSHGGSVSSPPSSPGPTKFKLADYRYGREEMLALFTKEYPPPDGVQNLGILLVKQAQEPLAFLPINPEEQRMWHQPVNSEAVLRGTGRSTMNGVGRGRGGSVDRGRGRGRGVAAPYYSRGISYDEEQQETRGGPRENGPPGIRPKGYERSQSMGDSRVWTGERAAAERSGGGEERAGAVSPRKDQGRATTDNWRSRNEKNEDRWRGLANPRDKWGNRPGWRERENGAEGEWDDGRGNRNRSSWDEKNEHYRRNHWDEDNLPEWATEESEDKGGSFDATGAFHAPGSSDEDEVKELPPEKVATPKAKHQHKGRHQNNERVDWSNEPKEDFNSKPNNIPEEYTKQDIDSDALRQTSPLVNGLVSDEDHSSSSSQSPSMTIKSSPSSYGMSHQNQSQMVKPYEDDKLEHMQSVADDLVAKLIEDDPAVEEPGSRHHKAPPPAGFLPAEPLQTTEEQWFYTDPQGDIQGPFSSSDMAAWCKAGYFKPDLLLRRECDDKFAQLGDLTRVFGRVPFLPGPPVPPLKVSELLSAQKAQAEREQMEMLQAYQLQKQQQIIQQNLRQQVLQQLQSLDEWSSLSASQQQQLFMQQMVVLQPQAPPIPTSNQPPIVMPPDHRIPPVAAPGGHIPVPAPAQQDPIQAFVAQMATTQQQSGSISSESVNSCTAVPPGGNASPLEKLLCQLKKTPPASSNAPLVPPGPPSNLLPSNKPPEQFDAIKSLMSQLTKIQMQGPDKIPNEDLRFQDEEQKRIEEENQRYAEMKKIEEERIKIQELRLHEERIKEEEMRKELEARNQKLEEELKKMQEEQFRRKEENQMKIDENKKFIEQHQKKNLEAQRKEEELRRQKLLKHEEEKRKEEEKRRKQEERKKTEEEKRKEEERKRKEEKERQQQLRVQEEMRRLALEEERRRMQRVEEEERKKQEEERRSEERSKKKEERNRKEAPLAWSNKEASSAPSLAEIQKAQEIKEKKEREAEAVRESQRQKEVLRQAADEKKHKEANIKWAAKVCKGAVKGSVIQPPPPVKSLKEIQKEEEKELKKRQEKEQAERAAAISHLSINAAGVWGSAAQSLSWANRASTGAPPLTNSQGAQMWGSQPGAWNAAAPSSGFDAAAWNQAVNQQSGGFWESPDTTKVVAAPPPKASASPIAVAAPRTTSKGGNNKPATQAVNSNKANKKKSKDESEAVKKLFNNISPTDSFTNWCKTTLHSMKDASIDIPTFVGFLADVESPYDVHDYIRSYLGDSKEVKEFAKQYLERRSRARNAHKERLEEDNILAPAPAVNPVGGLEFQEVKTRLKKGKKKMQKMDNSILGFNVAVDGDDSG